MRIEGNVIAFENLSRPDTDVVGEVKEVKAKTTKGFSASNAPGEFAENDLDGANKSGKACAARSKVFF